MINQHGFGTKSIGVRKANIVIVIKTKTKSSKIDCQRKFN